MRGRDVFQACVFSYVSLEDRVPSDHPLRVVRGLVDAALGDLSPQLEQLYASVGRPSIAPEKLMRALLLQALYSVRSERQLMDQINYNLLFRWFVGLEVDDAVWAVTVFTKNRERLVRGEVAERLLLAVLEQAHARRLLSEDHFTLDGTLIQAWANRASFHEKKDPPQRGSGHGGRKLLRDTHESKTDPEARLYKKSGAAAAVPGYLGHVVIENRHGMVVSALATQASTTAEREAGVRMLDRLQYRGERITLGADKGYQHEQFVQDLRQRGITPHVAEYPPNPHWNNHLTEAERSDPGYTVSLRKRKLVEKVFGWGKQDRAMRQVKLRGLHKVNWSFLIVATAHNLRRMQTLLKPA